MFAFGADDGRDRVRDLKDEVDGIRITGGARRFDDLRFAREGDDLVIRFAKTRITVEGLRPGALDARDFDFG